MSTSNYIIRYSEVVVCGQKVITFLKETRHVLRENDYIFILFWLLYVFLDQSFMCIF